MKILKKGDKGSHVTIIQELLNWALSPFIHLKVDGHFGQKTLEALLRFQAQHGLKPDGVVGPQTWTALGQKISSSPDTTPPTVISNVNKQRSWMEIAILELGISENHLPGKHNSRIVEYHSATSLRATDDETAWCSSFVNWVMKQAGYHGTKSAAAKSWLDWGSSLTAGKYGAITVVKKKNGKNDAATGSTSGFHVAFFESITSHSIRLLGGNQSDQVKYSNFNLASYEVKGYRWPS